MTLRAIPTYIDDLGNDVRFARIDHSKGAIPGYTHRVIINGKLAGLLSQDSRPSLKSAQYFLDDLNQRIAA